MHHRLSTAKKESGLFRLQAQALDKISEEQADQNDVLPSINKTHLILTSLIIHIATCQKNHILSNALWDITQYCLFRSPSPVPWICVNFC